MGQGGIRWRNLKKDSATGLWHHRPVIILPPDAPANLFASAAFSTLPANGTAITWTAATGYATAGNLVYLPYAWALVFTKTAGTTDTATFTVIGIDQFGTRQTETVSILAASTIVQTAYAYEKITSVTPTANSGGADTISIGFEGNVGSNVIQKIGTPWRIGAAAEIERISQVNGGISALMQLNISSVDVARQTMSLITTPAASYTTSQPTFFRVWPADLNNGNL